MLIALLIIIQNYFLSIECLLSLGHADWMNSKMNVNNLKESLCYGTLSNNNNHSKSDNFMEWFHCCEFNESKACPFNMLYLTLLLWFHSCEFTEPKTLASNILRFIFFREPTSQNLNATQDLELANITHESVLNNNNYNSNDINKNNNSNNNNN